MKKILVVSESLGEPNHKRGTSISPGNWYGRSPRKATN